ncbi:DNA-formamidopyrimidine glycosylase [Patescibacteria group bacterium]|nr:MAG: DNA-formamidopyrimidine glycosylase [Patescibacteria group bacterium]
MPELPEVTTIVEGLRKKVIGKKITDVWCDHQKMIQNSEFGIQKVIDAKIVDVKRRAKYIIIDLGNGLSMVMHLRMTGHLLYRPLDKSKYSKALDDPYNQFVHFKLKLDDNHELAFSDLRKFGTVEVMSIPKVKNYFENKEIGPEPLDESFTYEVFLGRINRKKGAIKTVLMDQTVIAGIGNIYADEILFEAGIHPKCKVNQLNSAELKKIYEAIRKVLKEAVKLRGTSISDFRDLSGERGSFEKALKVYRQTGKPCSKCGTKIERIVVGQRGTHFCPKCQK